MKDFLRTVLGIRKKRRSLPVTSTPRPGASLIRNGDKIKLNQPCDDELWDWLLLMGWRVCAVRNDRRRYRLLPADAIRRLKAASVDTRGDVLDGLIAEAKEAA